MSNIMKSIIIFFLLVHCEVYSLQLKSENHHHNFLSHQRSWKLHHKMRQQEIIDAIRKKFSANGKNPDESKLCNFLIGAVMESYKILLQKTGLAQIQKCYNKAVSTYKTALESPTKGLKELDQNQDVSDAAAQQSLNDTQAGDTNQEDPAANSEIAQSEQTAEEVNTQVQEDVKKEEGGAELLANQEQEQNLDSAAVRFSQIKLPNFFKNNTVSKALSGATEKLKSSVKKITSKLSDIVGKFKEKFNKIEEAVRKWFEKPIVKSLITFFACATKLGIAAFIYFMLKSITFILIIAKSISYLRLLIRGVKAIKTGISKTTIKEKYTEYGKGTADFAALIVLFSLGK